MEYRQGIPVDKCTRCGNEYPADELFYEGVKPDISNPKCRWCIIKEAQEKWGVNNVILNSPSNN